MMINILVCYHKAFLPIIHNEILHPIFLGASNADKQTLQDFKSLLNKQNIAFWRDDISIDSTTCQNISSLNPYFCELSAIYWAWKNLDSNYYGLFHYRRIFDLHNKTRKKSIEIQYNKFKNKNIENLQTQINKYDIIISAQYTESHGLYERYKEAHHINDLDLCINYIKEHYPYMKESLQILYIKNGKWSVANMFIMKKELYFEYCEWIFDVLFAVQDKINYKTYDTYQARVFGFLAERLFNVWLEYKKQTSNPKIYYAPIIFLGEPKPLFGFKKTSTHKQFYLFRQRIYKTRIKNKESK